jgi:peroxiredoxin
MFGIQVSLEKVLTVSGVNIDELSRQKQVLLVFLRHFGCTFCREAMEEIAELDAQVDHNKVDIVLVHMATNEVAQRYFQKYKISHLDHISDPECLLYKQFGLVKGNFNQLFGFRSWIRGLDAGIIKGHGWGVQLGDGFQMPGVFTILEGKVVSEFRHRFVSDKPDYKSMVDCSIS